MASAYQVELERDESGWWVARVPSVPGCHTQGRSIEQAINRIREALGLWVDDARKAELLPKIQLPKMASATVQRALEAREEARRADARAQKLVQSSVRELTQDALSVRDAARLLELSPARVQQIAAEAGMRPRPRPARAGAAKKSAAKKTSAGKKRAR